MTTIRQLGIALCVGGIFSVLLGIAIVAGGPGVIIGFGAVAFFLGLVVWWAGRWVERQD